MPPTARPTARSSSPPSPEPATSRVAVSSDGTSPAIASWLRDRISDEMLTPDVVAVAEEIATRRSAMQAAGESTEDRDWRAEIQRMFDARTDR